MNLSPLIRLMSAYVLGVLSSYVLASLFSTQSVVASLAGMGVDVGWGERIRMSLHDIVGLTGIFLPVIAAAFVIALPVAGWLSSRKPGWRKAIFMLAGAVSLVAVHLALKAAFDIIPIAGARSIAGLSAQALAGAIGGYIFVASRRTPFKQHTP